MSETRNRGVGFLKGQGTSVTQGQLAWPLPENRAQWLAQAFPARTLAAGANRIDRFNDVHGDERNLDMHALFKNGWPAERIANNRKGLRWLHSDIREVAYIFTHRAYDQIVQSGGLR
jgi:hypothetical protein